MTGRAAQTSAFTLLLLWGQCAEGNAGQGGAVLKGFFADTVCAGDVQACKDGAARKGFIADIRYQRKALA
jgi:hypothetical protein